MCGEAESRARASRQHELIDGPRLARLGPSTQLGGGESIEYFVIRGVDGDQLALQVSTEFGQADARITADARDLIAIRLALSGARQVEKLCIARRNLYADVTQACRPRCQSLEGVERRVIAFELGNKEPGAP